MGKLPVAILVAIALLAWASLAQGTTCQFGPYGLNCHFRNEPAQAAAPSGSSNWGALEWGTDEWSN